MESTKQIKIEIRNRWTGSVVFEYTKEGNTITETVLDAIRRGADLRGADLRGADLRDANLRDANLCDADLCDANLCGANLCGADIDYACWPLWCGGLHVKIDKRIACQLAYHFCNQDCDDPEYIEACNAILDFANQFHRATECGFLEPRDAR